MSKQSEAQAGGPIEPTTGVTRPEAVPPGPRLPQEEAYRVWKQYEGLLRTQGYPAKMYQRVYCARLMAKYETLRALHDDIGARA